MGQKEIIDLLLDYGIDPWRWFSAKEISVQIGISMPSVSDNLRRMKKWGEIDCIRVGRGRRSLLYRARTHTTIWDFSNFTLSCCRVLRNRLIPLGFYPPVGAP